MGVILNGNCLDVMGGMDSDSIDAIVTDPPYGLSFMGKRWDYDVPDVALWGECLRVLKPGGHLLSFGGSRTYHRMVVNIEDAGFEIRDQIMWLYGSGFPKSHNIGGGWGTALKPAHEPIVVARKPFKGTVAENVLEHGTGVLNIDGCRVEGAPEPTRFDAAKHHHDGWRMTATGAETAASASPLGRWPANVILDEEAGAMLDEQKEGASRFFYCPKASRAERNQGCEDLEAAPKYRDFGLKNRIEGGEITNKRTNEEARLTKNNHPTVKPVALMEYLIRLVTPPEGVVLDPFMGSGTTLIAAHICGVDSIGIEIDPDYCEIAKGRLKSWTHEDILYDVDGEIVKEDTVEWV